MLRCITAALLLQITIGASASDRAQAVVDGVVDRPDVRLHYRIYGDRGPYVVVLSGGPGGASRMLQPVADHLKDRFRAVLLEQRGTDRSKLARYDASTINLDAYIADIEAVRTALKQERIIVVGTSWGMTLGFAYTAAHPDRVLALATIGSGHLASASERAWIDNLQTRLSDDQKQRIAALSSRNLTPDEAYAEWYRIAAPAYFFKREEAAKSAAELRVGDLNGRIPPLVPGMIRRYDEYIVNRLDRIKSPVLVIQGRQDLAPQETAFLVRDKVKGSRIVFLDQCGHVPFSDQPEATWRILDEFLRPFLAV
jgi:proline iminopeptidase